MSPEFVEDWTDRVVEAQRRYLRLELNHKIVAETIVPEDQARITPLVESDANTNVSKALSDSMSDFFMLGKYLPLDRWFDVLNDMLFNLGRVASERHRSCDVFNPGLDVGETVIPTSAQVKFHEIRNVWLNPVYDPEARYDDEYRRIIKQWDVEHGMLASKGDNAIANSRIEAVGIKEAGREQEGPCLNENAFSNEETITDEWVPIDIILPELKQFFQLFQLIGEKVQVDLRSLVRQQSSSGFITREWTIKRNLRKLSNFLRRANRHLVDIFYTRPKAVKPEPGFSCSNCRDREICTGVATCTVFKDGGSGARRNVHAYPPQYKQYNGKNHTSVRGEDDAENVSHKVDDNETDRKSVV